MEDNLNFSENGRHPKFFRKWKTTSIFQKMEDDLNFPENGRLPQFKKLEDDLLFKEF